MNEWLQLTSFPMEAEAAQRMVLQDLDTVPLILLRLSSPQDILSASAVCRVWRMASMDCSHLRSWVLDDSLDNTRGLKTSSTPLLPKTPPPKHWINPTAHSPLASFKIPRSLLLHNRYCDETATPASSRSDSYLHEVSCESGLSPRTPSPVREPVKCRPLFDIVKEKVIMGRFLGEVDIMSSRMNDEVMQLLLRKCPQLHTFRLLHGCTANQNDYQEVATRIDMEAGSLHRTACGCSPLSERAFSNVSKHCPELASVTLILQHVNYRKTLQKILVELGRLPKLHTLSVELRMPSFGQSTKSKSIWESHLRFTEQEIYALIRAGPPPLHALALNRCDLTKDSIGALTLACPHIEALDLQSNFANPTEAGFPQWLPVSLQGLTYLSAAAFGVLVTLENCHFDRWQMPVIKRLRLESKDPLSLEHLQQLQSACPELESLHLIWSSPNGIVRETHIYPFTMDSFIKFVDNVSF